MTQDAIMTFFGPDRAIPQFKRLRFEEADVPRYDALTRGCRPGKTSALAPRLRQATGSGLSISPRSSLYEGTEAARMSRPIFTRPYCSRKSFW